MQIDHGADSTFANNVFQSPIDIAESMSDNKVLLQTLRKSHKVGAVPTQSRGRVSSAPEHLP